MDKFILTPPIAFIIVLFTIMIIAGLFSKLSFKSKEKPKGLEKAYACGEDMKEQAIQPDYGQFFPFAFFFTILHVATLMMTTIPLGTIKTFVIAIIYILGAFTALFILFRK